MTEINIFEQATREKLRFASPVGELTVEQIWDLPLTAKGAGRADLDVVSRAVGTELKGLDEVSFVDVKPNPRKSKLELQLAILIHVIAVKKTAAEAEAKRAQRAAERQRLLKALADKQEANLGNLSEDELREKIAAHDAAA